MLAQGEVGGAFEREIRRLIADCERRPDDNDVRTLALTLSLRPPVVDGAAVQAAVKVKSKIRKNGKVMVSQEIFESYL